MHESVFAVWDVLCQHLVYKLVVSRICNLAIKIHPGRILAYKKFGPIQRRKATKSELTLTVETSPGEECLGSFFLAKCQSCGKCTRVAKRNV